MRRPPRNTSPAASDANPDTALSRVVLPAPLGPMMPRISPGATVSDTLSTAVTPPKRTVTPRASSASGIDELLAAGPGAGQRLREADQPVGVAGHGDDDPGADRDRHPVADRADGPEHLGQ